MRTNTAHYRAVKCPVCGRLQGRVEAGPGELEALKFVLYAHIRFSHEHDLNNYAWAWGQVRDRKLIIDSPEPEPSALEDLKTTRIGEAK